jgi:hypothetical protein
MLKLVVETLLAPALIGASWLVSRRWGEQLGGTVSAFPAIAGTFLLLAAEEHGTRFAASAANGTLGGLLTLSGFLVAYSRTAAHGEWRKSLLVGWIAAATLAAMLGWLRPEPPGGLALAISSLLLARWLIPPGVAPVRPAPSPESEVLLCMTLGALLVCSLTLAATLLGSTIGGVLAGLPVIATVLAVSTHRRGANALYALSRGMLAGMVSFVLFCELISLLAVPAGTALAFASATLGAAAAQAALLYRRRDAAAGQHRPLSAQS